MINPDTSISCPVLIIGAGPAGLAVAGRLQKKDIPFEILEKSDKIAYRWHCHYDRLALHTVRDLSALPHMPFPKHYPTYVPRAQLIEYYEAYASHFNIQPRFNEGVVTIKKVDGDWLVQTKKGRRFATKHLVIGTGVNRVPVVPSWPGQDSFQGNIQHSRTYRNTQSFKGKKLLIIGMGNTGAEIALDMAENHIQPYLSVRSPVNIVPRDINGKPTQVTAKWLAKIPFGTGDWIGSLIRRWVVGDLRKYGLEMSKIHPAIQLRDFGVTPVIDLGTVREIIAGNINIVSDVVHFTKKGVVLRDGVKLDIDEVILATGYKAKLEELIPGLNGVLDKFGVPKEPISSGKWQGLYFVGFDNYKLGGILGTIYNDSKTIVDTIDDEINIHKQ
jgi:cation diffusion facilitator CzcD-associated flavoprotein CzcO